MSKTLRNVLTAAAVAMLVGFLFGALGAAVNSPDLGSVGLTLAASIGGITFFILHLRSGNRCVAQADSDARARALAFGCPPDRALVFFVRSGFAGGAVGVDVAIDGKTLAQIKSPRFTCVQLAPGEHALSAHVGGSASALNQVRRINRGFWLLAASLCCTSQFGAACSSLSWFSNPGRSKRQRPSWARSAWSR